MADSTDRAAAAAGQRWCHWHHGPSQTARLIQTVPRTSGPDIGLYACAPCRDEHSLTATTGSAS